jgi:ATP-dependent Clp protease ATP-binding subunit ClpC
MFERYTERARRVIFFSRYEASQFGSTSIETEHLLLGLLREDTELISRLAPNLSAVDLRRKIEQQVASRDKISTAIDLPLSDECKRILAYANEEADRLAQRFIGTEHLLLGILREEKGFASRILAESGLQVAAARDLLAVVPSGTLFPLADRASVHALVDRLPEGQLGRAHSMLQQLL